MKEGKNGGRKEGERGREKREGGEGKASFKPKKLQFKILENIGMAQVRT